MLQTTTAPPLMVLKADRIVDLAGKGDLHLGDARACRRVVNEAPRLQLRSAVWGKAPRSPQRRHYRRVCVVAVAYLGVAAALVTPPLLSVNS